MSMADASIAGPATSINRASKLTHYLSLPAYRPGDVAPVASGTRRLGGVGVLRKTSALVISSAVLVAAAWFPAAAPAATRAPKIAAVGDIACKNPPGNNRQVCQYDDVAAAIARRDYDRFLVLGDVQYEYGRYRDFVDNYDRYFGRLLPITEPVPGNHDYGTAG